MRSLAGAAIVVLLALTVTFGATPEPPAAETQKSISLKSESGDGMVLTFRIGDYTTASGSAGLKIESKNTLGSTTAGLPDLPVFSAFLQIEAGYRYETVFEVKKSRILHDVTLPVSKGIPFEDEPMEGAPQELSSDIFPEKNIILSQPMVMRGLVISSLEVIPFRYDPVNRELEIYEEMEISLTKALSDDALQVHEMPPSRVFEPLYKSLIVNYDPESRSEPYQQSAILYICGGGSNGSIIHPLLQQLMDWRRKQGYKVYAASTDETGSTSSQIKSYIQGAYTTLDPAPEYVVLVGDTDASYSIPTFTENWSWYGGEGDHPYSQLDGGDIFPEVVIGRLSADNSTHLSVIIAKTIAYEKASYISQTGTDWYTSAALVGDPSSSGLSTIITNQYIEMMMEVYGFDNVNGNYGNGNYPSWMQNHLEDGIGYFNYRGYIGTSGFSLSNINNANNGWRTPYVTFITCATGSFASGWGEAIVEEFIRAGTVSNPKGGVAAIGTATSGTHTAFNNILDMGIFEGIFSKEIETAGASLVNGKLALYNAYPSDPDNKVSIFTHWNNLMGDPALQLWTAAPMSFTVAHSDNIGLGSNYLEVMVGNNESGEPVQDARVVITDEEGEVMSVEFTDAEGIALVPLDVQAISDGISTLSITVLARNYIPYEGTVQITDSGVVVNALADQVTVTEVAGNMDGMLNPGEDVILSVPVYNFGDATAESLSLYLSTGSDLVTLINPDAQIAQLAPGATAMAEFEISLNNSAIHGEDPELSVFISDAASTVWSSVLPLMIHGSKLSVYEYSVEGGGSVQPGDTVDLTLFLLNTGELTASGVTGVINDPGPWNYFDILDADIGWGDIPGENMESSADVITLAVSSDVVNGSVLPLEIHLTSPSGYDRTEVFHIQVGEVSVTDPLGPDSYGYYIYDSGDLGYSLAVPYNWIEIDPDLGGNGTSLGLYDNGHGEPVSQQPAHLDLPFTFTFYGVDYDEITVCSNGWIAMGYTEMSSFRNYELPGAGGPSPMISAFWDDLTTNNGGQVYSYYDEDNDMVIIEWSGMRTFDQNSVETFQIILMNSMTPTGDDEILIQYKEFNNTTVGNMSGGGIIHGSYATIGIENQYGNEGLQYTFNNQYPVAAMELENETALFITTRQPSTLLKGDVNMDGELNILDVIMVVNDLINAEPLDVMQKYIADMNEDGIVNVLDVILIINEIIG